MTGWISLLGWVALVAVNSVIESQLILALAQLEHPGCVPQRWHRFFIHIAVTILAFLINAFGSRLLPMNNQVVLASIMAGFIVINITALACAAPDHAGAEFVFTNFTNSTGWPDGLAWLLGLLQGGLALTAFDAVAHMVSRDHLPLEMEAYTDALTDRGDTKRIDRRAKYYGVLSVHRHQHGFLLPHHHAFRLW